jgi:AcrR family transcriptional regulator
MTTDISTSPENQGDMVESLRRGRSPAGQDPAKRQQIIDGARRVFIDMGFDAASMNDITREAGVSKGTIYVYFANKEELFEALIDEERCRIFNDLYEALERDSTDLRASLIRFGIALATKITSDNVTRAQRTVIGICERIPELGARFYERGPRNGHAKLMEFLKRAVAKGEVAIDDIELAAYQLTDLCLAGFYRQRLFGYRTEAPHPDEIRATVAAGVDVFLRAYSTRPVGLPGSRQTETA